MPEQPDPWAGTVFEAGGDVDQAYQLSDILGISPAQVLAIGAANAASDDTAAAGAGAGRWRRHTVQPG